MKSKIWSFVLSIMVCLVLFGCKGGGWYFGFGKPVCATNTVLQANLLNTVYGGFSSKKYVCRNGNFEPDGDDYRCVPPTCDNFITDGISVGRTGCGWEKEDIVKRPSNGNFYLEKSFRGEEHCLYKATCLVDGTIKYDIIPKWYQVWGGCEDNGSPPPPSTPNYGDYSSNPTQDPRIRKRDVCTENSNFRMESTCGGDMSSQEYLALQTCQDIVYVDKSEDERKIHLAFLLKDAASVYAFALVVDYVAGDIIQPVQNTSTGKVLYFTSFLDGKYSDARNILIWNLNPSTKLATGVLEANFDVNNINVRDGQTVYPLLLKRASGRSNGYVAVGSYCTFDIKTSYSVDYPKCTPACNYTSRAMNLLVFKNKNETTFHSDITKYDYNGLSFTDHVEKTFGEDAHVKVNYSYQTLPDILVDGNGNAVLSEVDLNLIGKNFLVGNSNVISPEDFRTFLVDKWIERLNKYNRYLGGDFDGNNTFNVNAVEMEDLTKTLQIGRSYSNMEAVVVINGFTIVKANGNPSEHSMNLTNWTNNLISTGNFSSIVYDGVTRGKGTSSNYSPISIVFASQAQEYFALNTPEYSGRIISVALHEMAHGWYNAGAANERIGLPYFSSHVARNYKWDDVRVVDGYYCLMKPKPSANAGTGATKAFMIGKMNRMSFSKGVLDRLRNVMSVTH